ncbi:MAG TPA: hypothetical protein VMS64_30375, partial [Candidatus Methylomirabilis sp.]|nr:hypothetical protein [Candidatus Methylomirabilis sp.]
NALPPASLTVTIDWGDGSGPTAAGLVTQVGGAGGTTYLTNGTHTYTADGAFTITFSVRENAAPTTNTDTRTQVADVEEGSQQFGAVQDQSFTGIVATFTDPSGSGRAPGGFTATIDWGDGKPTTAGVVGGLNGGPYSVTGTHTYATAGTFTVTVDFAGAASGTITSAAIVSPFATASATALTPTEGSSFSGQVATFVTSDTLTTAASYTATIDWGDGTTTNGSVTGVNPNFIVNGSHTYGDEATLAATVTITDGSAATAVVDKVTVGEGDTASSTPLTFSATAGVSFSGTVGSFRTTNPTATAADFTSTIDWGDASVTVGTVVANSNGGFDITGSHTYTTSGTFTVTARFSDDAPGTQSSTITSTCNVAAGTSALQISFSVANGTVTNGQPFVVALAINATNIDATFGSAVDFAVSGLPPGATATFNPASVSLPASGTFTGSVVMTIQTQGPTSSAVGTVSTLPPPPWTHALLLALCLMATIVMLRRQVPARRWAIAAMLLAVVMIGMGCGGKNGQTTQTPGPTGTFNVTATARSGSVTASRTLQHIVQ